MFSQKTIDFLFENKLQNSKIWYDDHKADFKEHVLTPLAELVTKLAPTMLSIDDMLICDPKVDKTISRIYRDTRFSKDKSLYRDHMWCSFKRDKKIYTGFPEFFFDVSPAGFCYGFGYYAAGPDSMESMRALILGDDKDFRKALKAIEKQNVFAMDGECYKRSKYPEKPTDLRNWLDRKSIYFIRNSEDFKTLYAENLTDILAEDYKILEPVYKFLLKAELRKHDK